MNASVEVCSPGTREHAIAEDYTGGNTVCPTEIDPQESRQLEDIVCLLSIKLELRQKLTSVGSSWKNFWGK